MAKLNQNLKLTRRDGKVLDVIYYDNFDIDEVKILDIKKLKFEGMKTKDIKKNHIQDAIFNGKEKVYLQNKISKIVAGLSKKHLNKIISTVFTKDSEGKYGYLKKEIISNVDTIFFAAVPILKHPELKTQALYHNQVIHRLALPLKIGGLAFLVMITVKERIDNEEMKIDKFSIYDLYSEAVENKKSFDSPSTVSYRTFRSHYRMITYSIDDLIDFVNLCVKKNYG